METVSDLLMWFRAVGLVLITMVALKGCSSSKHEEYNQCEEAKLETWTSEFITRMNAGYLPDEANQIAEVVSVKTLALCMDEQQHKMKK